MQKSGFPGKNLDFQKTWIHKFSLNLKLWHYEKEIILTLSYFPKWENPEFRSLKIWIFEVFWLKSKSFCKIILHTKTHNIVTPNDSLMTKNKLIIETMKIRGCGGHVTLRKWKPRDKTQMVNPWDHAANSKLLKIS